MNNPEKSDNKGTESSLDTGIMFSVLSAASLTFAFRIPLKNTVVSVCSTAGSAIANKVGSLCTTVYNLGHRAITGGTGANQPLINNETNESKENLSL